ncbi:GH36-type glycosyl hydrolase domain-containing protein [Mesobacillus subterraneus]|uniref:Cellobiose phosphorylase n=1 Tax=Mesobacillus subterraneus TaxID=285983 RepID=A0A3R9F1E9_9BACI|nr:amylo-alpha-1,6-glucosidase [Mesobacillus subterraneus]RSD26998.1 cellobiose phosphorylase [Mesobacillus subterraneus]
MTQSKFTILANDLSFTFLHSGDVYEIAHKTTMINQWLSNPIDGSMNNLFLRVHSANGIEFYPLLGSKSDSTVSHSDNQAFWKGETAGLQYKVTFTVTEQGIWFWDVEVEGNDATIDIVYGQDLGLADKGAVRTNEAYMSQYIDHNVFNDAEKGYVVCSRQNQPMSGGFFPYSQQGSLTKTAGYSTDGFQFFGLSYKETDVPEVLTKEHLANEVYQYEFAYTALQSEKVTLNGKAQFVFYGIFKENHQAAITELEFTDEVAAAWEHAKTIKAEQAPEIARVNLSPAFGKPLETVSMSKEEIDELFPNRHQEETTGDTLLSFFTEQHEHVVLKEKELLVERPHGHILMSGGNVDNIKNVLTTTLYMYGIFNSHIVVGNTSFNKMLTNARNALNVMKTSGQRIYVEIDGEYRLLTMPSMFEMGFNYGRWYYKTNDDMIIATTHSAVDSPQLQLQVRSANGKAYRFLVTNQVSMNNNEYAQPFNMKQDGNVLTFTAGKGSNSSTVFPELSYRMQISENFEVKNSSVFGKNIEASTASLALLELEPVSEWNITVQGLLDGKEIPFMDNDTQTEIENYRKFFAETMNGFKLAQNGEATEELKKVNALAWWYTHNMLVHYSVPHGLEQYGGAAWGTRDVCQGPTEYFIATQKYENVKEIIKTVYSHQYHDDGNWPQWFMFDNYYRFQQEESHGDIIVWPLKVIVEYLRATNDYTILQEMLPYTEKGSFEFTAEKVSLLDHVKKQIQYIKDHFLHDTHLSSYGDGDWDDTLQPANAQLKQYMASSWTVALTYQVMNQFASLLQKEDALLADELSTMAEGIKEDFNKYMLSTEIIPGFVFMEQPDHPELMVHPTDTKTGIQYRLLPMTRSMIGELLTPEQAESHYEIIQQRLYHPDGVRLMDRPATYKGGVSTNFKRAEQASNFGREIGLQYVHAHIRFVEAMAKLGKVDEVWKGLQTINPIGIQKVVPNAELRQSNAYFSSSDGKFNTRYEAAENFEKLRDGSAPVKGGWRIYSSGPGIYMNQLISNALGIRREAQDLIIDPVLPEEMDGLEFAFNIDGKPVTFIYHFKGEASVKVNGEGLEAARVSNRYRDGGYRIEADKLEKLNAEKNTIEITM